MKHRQALIYFSLILISLLWIASCQFFQPQLKTETPLPTFRLGFNNWPGCAVWQIASEQGIFEKNNLDIDLQFSDYTTGITTFANNQLDGNCQTLFDTIYMLGTNSSVDPVIVALTDWSTGGDQIIAASNVQNIQQLKGKKVAFELGSVGHYLLLMGLEKYGLKLSDIQKSNNNLIRNLALFFEEEVDAIVTYMPFVKEALNRPGSQTLLTSQDFPGAISDHLVVNRQFLENNPQVVKGLVKTWFDTVEFMKKNPDLSRQIIAYTSGLTLQDLKDDESKISIKGLSDNLTAFEPGDSFASLPYAAQNIYDFLRTNKLIENSVDIQRILDSSFLANAQNR
ncbi:MAG: ABC transporter substrate-binding protein [Planktothrix sp.]